MYYSVYFCFNLITPSIDGINETEITQNKENTEMSPHKMGFQEELYYGSSNEIIQLKDE